MKCRPLKYNILFYFMKYFKVKRNKIDWPFQTSYCPNTSGA